MCWMSASDMIGLINESVYIGRYIDRSISIYVDIYFFDSPINNIAVSKRATLLLLCIGAECLIPLPIARIQSRICMMI